MSAVIGFLNTVFWQYVLIYGLLAVGLSQPGGILLTAVGIACGYYFGTMLAEALFGDGVVPSSRDNTISWIITGVAGVSASFFFHARGKQPAFSAQQYLMKTLGKISGK